MEIPLVELSPEKKAKITRFEGGLGFQSRLESLGLRVGKVVSKVADQPLRGPIVVEVNGCRVALGYGMATKVFVEA